MLLLESGILKVKKIDKSRLNKIAARWPALAVAQFYLDPCYCPWGRVGYWKPLEGQRGGFLPAGQSSFPAVPWEISCGTQTAVGGRKT